VCVSVRVCVCVCASTSLRSLKRFFYGFTEEILYF